MSHCNLAVFTIYWKFGMQVNLLKNYLNKPLRMLVLPLSQLKFWSQAVQYVFAPMLSPIILGLRHVTFLEAVQGVGLFLTIGHNGHR